MHFEDGRGEYFDSFGRRPTANFERYLNRHCSSWTFNRRQLQSVISNFYDLRQLTDVYIIFQLDYLTDLFVHAQ